MFAIGFKPHVQRAFQSPGTGLAAPQPDRPDNLCILRRVFARASLLFVASLATPIPFARQQFLRVFAFDAGLLTEEAQKVTPLCFSF